MKTLSLLLLLALGGCTMNGGEREEDVAGISTAIAAKIKAAMIDQAPTAAAAVNVEVREDTVYLEGFADDPEMRNQLEAAARKATKFRVVNRIELR